MWYPIHSLGVYLYRRSRVKFLFVRQLTLDQTYLSAGMKLELLREDPLLQPLWEAAKLSVTDPSQIHYVIQNDYLFRCVPNKHQGETMQVIIPLTLREKFLQFAHTNPLSGHLGRMKTLRRLLNVVYWPEIRKDVWSFCTTCQTCQIYKPRISKLSGYLVNTSGRTWPHVGC